MDFISEDSTSKVSSHPPWSLIILPPLLFSIFCFFIWYYSNYLLFHFFTEYFINIILIVSLIFYWRKRTIIDNKLFFYLFASILTITISNLILFQNQGVPSFSNLIGQILKIFSYWFIYMALVYSFFKQPFALYRHTLQLEAEKKIQLSEYRFSEVFKGAPVPMMIISIDTGTINDINPAFTKWLGYSLQGITDDKHWEQRFLGYSPTSNKNTWWHQFKGNYTANDHHQINDFTVYDALGNPHIGRASIFIIGSDVIVGWTDLTQIRQDEIDLLEREQNLQRMIEQPFVGMYVRNKHTFLYVNTRFCDIIGWSQKELKGKTLIDIVGKKADTIDLILKKWHELQQNKNGLSYTLPFKRKDGTPIILGLHGVPITWNNEPAVLAMIEDITELEHAREKINNYLQRLKSALKNTLMAVANTVEFRDPYTAGHERRVGLIAKAISLELGWDTQRSDSLELMGLVHDIGKIAIPSEILSKPARLSFYEMELVKEHPQTGYDILKDIEFDFPVAEVILQHHERLNGSGYPRGLKGDEIIIEARIIAIADVLESMSSHRPYRPSLGMDAAINEIKQGRGILYDAEIVDIVIKLYKENRLTNSD